MAESLTFSEVNKALIDLSIEWFKTLSFDEQLNYIKNKNPKAKSFTDEELADEGYLLMTIFKNADTNHLEGFTIIEKVKAFIKNPFANPRISNRILFDDKNKAGNKELMLELQLGKENWYGFCIESKIVDNQIRYDFHVKNMNNYDNPVSIFSSENIWSLVTYIEIYKFFEYYLTLKHKGINFI